MKKWSKAIQAKLEQSSNKPYCWIKDADEEGISANL